MEIVLICGGIVLFIWWVSGISQSTDKNHGSFNAEIVEKDVLLRVHESTLQSQEEVIAQLRDEIRDLEKQCYALKEERAVLKERELQLKAREQQLHTEFQVLARDITHKSAEALSKTSSESMKKMLDPLSETIENAKKSVLQASVDAGKERAVLQNEVQNLLKQSLGVQEKAENLTNALRGNSKIRGNWGEMQLENILVASGLDKTRDYILQGAGQGLKDETGKVQRPDAIVRLSENHQIVIDAKVNLVSYEKYMNADTPGEQEQLLKQLVSGIRKQITELSSKDYQNNTQIISPNFVVMFFPIDYLYTCVFNQDTALYDYACTKNVLCVGPSSLFALLRTVHHILSRQRQLENNDQIIEKCGALYDKFVTFLGYFEKLGKHVEDSHVIYKQALTNLKDGQGNIIAKVQAIKKLGLLSAKDHSLLQGNTSEESD